MVKALKSLELQGVKTFATITQLEFPGQITAIVGPNGSGKSNIADSIRWVLGEQSYSMLRARKTEDMIFSGSQQRSRAGMASATITFNNEDGWLPIDYSAVSIARRAYRDGQNEYLLNGQKVRLKDISELLSQTGLSERTYTIIGQGLVDVALALKPDERRKLFEEAAGIGLFRARKEESLRRLETTRKNLDRVLDIMTEIKPRLRSLEKQASRFEEFQRLRSELHELLREWYGYHWHQKQHDLRSVRSAYQNQEQKLSALRLKYSEIEKKVETAREDLQIKRKDVEAAHNELSAYHRKLEQTTRELAIIDERQRSHIHQKSNLEIDIANVEEEITELLSQEEGFKAEIERRRLEFQGASEELNQVKIQLSEVSSKKDEIDHQLEESRKTRIALETEKVQITARLEELTNRIEAYKREKNKISESLRDLDKDKDVLIEKASKFEEEHQATQNDFSILQNKTKTISVRLEDLKSEKQTIEQQLSVEETRSAKLQAQLDVLNQAEAALSGYSEGSKRVVEDSRKGQLPTGIEPLSKHIIIDEKYEEAISAALGELTDLLIVPSEGKELVVQYLESKDNDRVALVTLDPSHSPKKSRNLPKNKGMVGYASDLIQVDEKYRGLVDNLFSNILIVNDKESAQNIQSSLVGSEKAVTLSGLVFHANGIIFSGQGATGKRIGRTRKQSEIQRELEQLAEKITRLSDKKENVSISIIELKNEYDSLVRTLHKTEEIQNENRKILQEMQESITRVDEQIAWHNERLETIESTHLRTQESILTGEQQLGSINAKIDVLVGDEKILLSSLSDLPIFEMQQNLNHWQTHQIVTENALETAQQRYQDHHHRIEDAEQRLKRFQSRLAEIDWGLHEIEQSKTLLKEQISSIHQSIEALKSERVTPLTTKIEEFEKNVSVFQKAEAETHQNLVIAERQYTQLELELSRRNDQLNNLRERIEDDFGLVEFDYAQKIDGPAPLPYEDSLIEDLPRVKTVSDSIEGDIKRLKGQVRRMGAINPEAQQEYFEVKERFEYLTNQISDLEKASKDLEEVIEKLDTMMERDFLQTFEAVGKEFSEYFSRLFNGGEAKLKFSDEEHPVEGGVDIEARLPGRRRQGLALLSGGERSLTAVALIFALLKVSPTPFCVLDEVDAMLDESNVGRFIELLRELSEKTQFVIITHNRNTVQAADVIYGVTMGRDSTSQMISLKLEDVDETYLE